MLRLFEPCALHFIRCLNPNHSASPSKFDGAYVLDQVVQCGTVELVRVMHSGFPCRLSFAEVRAKYVGLLPAAFAQWQPRAFSQMLFAAMELDPARWSTGLTKVFLKASERKVVEDLRRGGFQPDAAVLARVRASYLRRTFRAALIAVLFCGTGIVIARVAA